MTVTIEEMKERLEELVVRAAERHEDLLIARNGAPWARVVPLRPGGTEPRVPGIDRGKFVVSQQFFEPLPEEMLQAFEGRS